MTFKLRRAFTLAELLIAMLIFSFMMLSMVGIYSAANKHMFQNYRQNAVRSGALVAMKTITARLQEANRIDIPAAGAAGNVLAFAGNVDNFSGCYRINPAITPSWHFICHAPAVTVACPYGNCLYHHTGTIAGGGGCPGGPYWAVSYPVVCGQSGGTITQLAYDVVPTPSLFYRTDTDFAGRPLVKVRLRVFWDPPTDYTPGVRDFRSVGRRIDSTLVTAVKLNIAAP